MFLFLLLTAAPLETLTVALRCDNHAAPLHAACLRPGDFSRSYGLSLTGVSPRERYVLAEGRKRTLVVDLHLVDSDSEVIAALLSGRAQVGLAVCTDVMQATIAGQGTRILAPLQHRGDALVVGDSTRAHDWQEFVGWAKARAAAVPVGHVGEEPTALLSFEQALDFVDVTHSRDTTGKIRLVRFADWLLLTDALRTGRVLAAVVREPEATHVNWVPGSRVIADLQSLPPNRFENAPGTIIASTDSLIRTRRTAIDLFLELMGCATHYANNHTRNTLKATCDWLGESPACESTSMSRFAFSSMPDLSFRDGLWNWYFALRLRGAIPESLGHFMERDEWLGVPWDSSLAIPALDRAGTRFIK